MKNKEDMTAYNKKQQDDNATPDLFLWASPHKPTAEQLNTLHGQVIFLAEEYSKLFEKMIDSPSDGSSLYTLADDILFFCRAKGLTLVQPAGSPAFQMALGVMKEEGGYYDVDVMYAHSKRESEDIPQPDGSVRKVAVFRHLGWVSM